ncbi:MAG: hypothetical protein CL971_06360 [Euryarchaeota archaeon]|nr:hypothetical protein [Euryarchaeota archaeon]
MSGKLTTILVLLIVIFIGWSYIYVINNPIEINIQATIGSTEVSTTSSSTTSSSTSTTTSSSTTSSSTSTTTTIPTPTTTIEVSEKDDSVSINTDSSENIEIYEGEFTVFDGFEGENQFNLDALVNNLPEELRKSVENNVIFVNGCHTYAATILGRCPFGVWDSAGTFADGSTNSNWKLSVWISNKAFANNRAYNTLLHETSHAFSYLTRSCVNSDGINQRKDAQEFFGSEELFADALVLYYGGDYVYYRDNIILSNTEVEYLTGYMTLCRKE